MASGCGFARGKSRIEEERERKGRDQRREHRKSGHMQSRRLQHMEVCVPQRSPEGGRQKGKLRSVSLCVSVCLSVRPFVCLSVMESTLHIGSGTQPIGRMDVARRRVEPFFLRRMLLFPDICAADVTKRTDVLALVMRFCVQLLVKRGATTLSSLNTLRKAPILVHDVIVEVFHAFLVIVFVEREKEKQAQECEHTHTQRQHDSAKHREGNPCAPEGGWIQRTVHWSDMEVVCFQETIPVLTPCQSACRNPTSGMRRSVSPPQPGKSAWLHGLFLRSCGGDSAVSPNIDSLIFVSSSSRPPAPLLRPHLAHLAQFAPAYHTSSKP